MSRPYPIVGQTKSREEIHRDLAADSLLQFSEVRFVARGSSMLPAIFPGDCLTIKPFGDARARVGEVVLVRRAGEFRVHRIVRIVGHAPQTSYILRGDALTQHDPPVSRSEILGRVSSVLRRGESVLLSSVDTLPQRLLRALVRQSSLVAAMLLRWNALHSRPSLGDAPLPAIAGKAPMECR